MKKMLLIFAIIAIVALASFIGWLVLKYAIGLVAFFIFAMGFVCGFVVCSSLKIIAKKSN